MNVFFHNKETYAKWFHNALLGNTAIGKNYYINHSLVLYSCYDDLILVHYIRSILMLYLSF